MKQLTNISILLLLFVSSMSYGQVTISRQVIGSTGSFATGTSMTLSSTVGEAVVQSLFSVNNILTQGFQQPSVSITSVVNYEVINESCNGAKNGSIFINSVPGCAGPYSIIITAVGDSVQLGADTLSTGNYDVLIQGSNGCTSQITVFVGLDSDGNCLLKFYSGITPNGDGINDVWIIDNIEMFPDNTVQIFNRWGSEVWFEKNYDNVNVVWQGYNSIKEEGDPMEDGTYFYIATIAGFDKPFKGWVELTR